MLIPSLLLRLSISIPSSSWLPVLSSTSPSCTLDMSSSSWTSSPHFYRCGTVTIYQENLYISLFSAVVLHRSFQWYLGFLIMENERRRKNCLKRNRLRARGLARGRQGTNQEKSIILAGLRRVLSLPAAKAHSSCLLDRVARVGKCHRQAAKRRAWIKREEEKMQEERVYF